VFPNERLVLGTKTFHKKQKCIETNIFSPNDESTFFSRP
jgi:hypothetical protein